TPEMIADNQIDLWRLDLMNPDPIVVAHNGHSVQFNRLSDVVLSYVEDSVLYVCVHNGKKAVCFYGSPAESTTTRVSLPTFKVSEKPFAWHYSEYVRKLPEVKNPPGLDSSLIRAGRFSLTIGIDRPSARSLYLPVYPSALQVMGRNLV